MERILFFERQHTRWGYLFITATLALLSLAYYYQWGTHPIPLAGYAILTIMFIGIFLLFCKMETLIDEQNLQIRYGLFGFSKTIPLSDIVEAKQVKYPWYYGVGIRMLPNSTLYSVNFSKVVEIQLKGSEHTLSVGTEKANEIIEALRRITEKNL